MKILQFTETASGTVYRLYVSKDNKVTTVQSKQRVQYLSSGESFVFVTNKTAHTASVSSPLSVKSFVLPDDTVRFRRVQQDDTSFWLESDQGVKLGLLNGELFSLSPGSSPGTYAIVDDESTSPISTPVIVMLCVLGVIALAGILFLVKKLMLLMCSML